MPNRKNARALYELPSPLYAPGSTFLIAGGVLLEAEGLQYCRLRLQVIGEMRVRSVTAAVQPLDAAGEALGLELPHRFLGKAGRAGAHRSRRQRRGLLPRARAVRLPGGGRRMDPGAALSPSARAGNAGDALRHGGAGRTVSHPLRLGLPLCHLTGGGSVAVHLRRNQPSGGGQLPPLPPRARGARKSQRGDAASASCGKNWSSGRPSCCRS